MSQPSSSRLEVSVSSFASAMKLFSRPGLRRQPHRPRDHHVTAPAPRTRPPVLPGSPLPPPPRRHLPDVVVGVRDRAEDQVAQRRRRERSPRGHDRPARSASLMPPRNASCLRPHLPRRRRDRLPVAAVPAELVRGVLGARRSGASPHPAAARSRRNQPADRGAAASTRTRSPRPAAPSPPPPSSPHTRDRGSSHASNSRGTRVCSPAIHTLPARVPGVYALCHGAVRACYPWCVTETTNIEADEELTDEEKRRKAAVLQMLADRDKRQPMSRAEIRRMRDEGRC